MSQPEPEPELIQLRPDDPIHAVFIMPTIKPLDLDQIRRRRAQETAEIDRLVADLTSWGESPDSVNEIKQNMEAMLRTRYAKIINDAKQLEAGKIIVNSSRKTPMKHPRNKHTLQTNTENDNTVKSTRKRAADGSIKHITRVCKRTKTM